MSAVVSTVKLQLNVREFTFVVPVVIAAIVSAVSIIIALVFWRAGSEPGSAGWIENSQANPGMMYSLPGFLVYLGIASVASTFPFALSLGTTRRSFVTGTVVWNLLMSTYVAAIFVVLTAIEIATDHWFIGFYIFDVNVLGAGDLVATALIVFLGVLTCLTVGGVFAASWVRFAARGPQAIAVGLVLVLGLAAIILVPEAPAIFATFEAWWLAVAALAVSVIAAAGTWLLLRTAIVR